jgi:hypothetical protein
MVLRIGHTDEPAVMVAKKPKSHSAWLFWIMANHWPPKGLPRDLVCGK